MDLDRCPKCGSKWTGGEFCSNCRWVPIGSGIHQGKKKKKKKAKYVEPGSSRGLLTFLLIGLLAYGGYAFKPWKDDWEMVRTWFGKGRHHSLVGEWEVVKTISMNPQEGLVSRNKVQKGSFRFTDRGNVTMDLVQSDSETTATGSYRVDGTTVAMQDLRSTGDSADQMPSNMTLKLAWTGSDDVVAVDKVEAIFLRKRKMKNPLTTFMQVGLKGEENSGGGQIPGVMRGPIGDIKRSIQDNGDFANNN